MKALKVIVLFGLISSCASVKYKAQEPFTERYEINDPRNPDCGCHTWQRQADREFQKLQKEELALKNEAIKSSPPVRRRKSLFNKTKSVKHKRIHLKLGKAVDCFKWQ